MHILRALPKYARLDVDDLEDAPPPKTGETWSIPVRPPLAELLFRQCQRSYTRWPQGWVFPNSQGGHLSYPNWLNRGCAGCSRRVASNSALATRRRLFGGSGSRARSSVA